MKRFCSTTAVTLLLLLLLPQPVLGQENWKITEFFSDIYIKTTGVVDIQEQVTVDFGSEPKHGIYRDIPYIYQNSGSKVYSEIDVASVLRGDAAEKYEIFAEDSFVRIKIGDPDKTFSGAQKYTINYSVSGVLKGYDAYDELYWNVTGNSWEVPIEESSAALTLPSEGVLQTACYQGQTGSTEECLSAPGKQVVVFNSTRALNAGEGLTVALGYTKGMVPLPVGKAPKTVADDFFKPINVGLTLLVLLGGLLLILNLWLRKGRDLWFGRNYLLGSQASVAPVGAKETIVVEYSPPENLRPAELAALLDEKAETLDVTATLVDLANRGFLTITEEPKKWTFGSADYIFERSNKKAAGLLEYEEELLLRLFDEGDLVKMSALKNKFYKDLALVKEKLYLNLADKKFFIENPNKVRWRYSLLAILLGLVGGGSVWLGFSLVNGLLVMLGATLALHAIVFLIVAQFMPARTALGRQMFARARGYKLFIETAEKYRQQFFEKKNLFNEVLPYAIVFGLTEKFAKAFAELGIETEKPDWFHSSSSFNAVAFGSVMNSFSATVSSSIASSPSSSGSGGGGSGGGGFGGGGGGSW